MQTARHLCARAHSRALRRSPWLSPAARLRLVISKLDRLENGQLELHGGLRNLDGKVERILEIVQGLAASRAKTDERVAAQERAASR